MTSTNEARCIRLYQEGASYKAIAQAFDCPLGTVASRLASLVVQGKIQPRPRPKAQPGRKPRPPRLALEPPAPVVLSPQARKAALVARCRQMKAEGRSLQAIAAALNAEGVPTISGYTPQSCKSYR